MAFRRIQKELQEISRDPPYGYSARPEDHDIFHWTATILGPEGTPYEERIFYADICFPSEYPFKPPYIYLKTKINHPNFKPNGKFCLKSLCYTWEPSRTIAEILGEIREMIAEPIPDFYMNLDIGRQYKTDKFNFDKIAREWTRRYAT